ncbi:AbiH family protein, partial [Bacteroidota bacterium]
MTKNTLGEDKNLILILGNGFDLAHGIPTSYNDFSKYILNKIIVDELITEKTSLISDNFILKLKTKSTQHFPENLEYIKLHTAIAKKETQDIIDLLLLNNKKLLLMSLNNSFLRNLFANNYDNWFDIEHAYFEELLNKFNQRDRAIQLQLIIKHNSELNELKNLLISYLKPLNKQNYHNIRHFDTRFYQNWDNIYIINFNYTDTIFHYFRESNEQANTRINFIHGDLEARAGEIVFGYGNDQHKKYNELKESKIDECLEFFKTYSYLRKKEYQNVFSEAIDVFNNYQVAVLGHSLGETDKTLLKEIFENDKCKKIHLFKRGDLGHKPEIQLKEHNKLFYAISRIITKDSTTRNKV